MAMSIEDGKAYRKAIHQAVTQAGRDPQTAKLVMFATFSLGDTVREALDRRRELDARVDEQPRNRRLLGRSPQRPVPPAPAAGTQRPAPARPGLRTTVGPTPPSASSNRRGRPGRPAE
ncbi:hypothetical protein ACFQ3Z_45325 [Streptomyces nogalater]